MKIIKIDKREFKKFKRKFRVKFLIRFLIHISRIFLLVLLFFLALKIFSFEFIAFLIITWIVLFVYELKRMVENANNFP